MEREIKFRAFVGRMEYDIMLGKFGVFYINSGITKDGLDPNDKATLTPFNTKLDNAILMQFTGLFDKNGKEIYEGDIVECEQFGQKQKGKVIFRKGMWSWEFKKGKDSWLYECVKQWKGEIIGNIYENPELLN